jgi:hypothetical protein
VLPNPEGEHQGNNSFQIFNAGAPLKDRAGGEAPLFDQLAARRKPGPVSSAEAVNIRRLSGLNCAA